MKSISSLLLFLFVVCICHAQKISYRLDFSNAAHHEARITVEVSDAKTSSLVFRMSRSSPGRYATHEFGKNVYNVSADPSAGNIKIRRLDGDVYEISGINGTARFSYTLYGYHADGTYAYIDPSGIHLNAPATFMWAEGLENAPVEIELDIPDTSFTVATQLKPGRKPNVFAAPNLHYLMDSPIKIGKLHWRTWNIKGEDRPMRLRLALEAQVSDAGVDSLRDMLAKITAQARKVFGEYPDYENGEYTFIASINPYVAGDGMEHRNSTMITLPMQFTLDPGAIDVFAHEFFHGWNVERIRPKTLEPFNFRKSNMSNELWCAEGFTEYYGELIMRRAGILPDTSIIGPLSAFVNQKTNSPGGTLFTPIDASNMAVFTDAGVSIDKNNNSNIFYSYYYYGASVAMALDLHLRTKYHSSLDMFMQKMWQQHGKTEEPYAVEDMQAILGTITGDAFAKDFFNDHVYGSKVPDYRSLLVHAGMELKRSSPGKAWIGNLRTTDKNGVTLTGNTIRNTPAYTAGLDINDVITELDGQPVTTIKELNSILDAHRPGETLKIVYLHRNTARTATIKLEENPALHIVTFESTGKKITPEILKFRTQWLGEK